MFFGRLKSPRYEGWEKLHRLEEEENVKTVDIDSLPLRKFSGKIWLWSNGMVEERALTGPSWQWD